jgi:hypothetical protein
MGHMVRAIFGAVTAISTSGTVARPYHMGLSGTNRREDRVTLDAGVKINIRAQLAGGGGANKAIVQNRRWRMLDPTKMGWKDPRDHMEYAQRDRQA